MKKRQRKKAFQLNQRKLIKAFSSDLIKIAENTIPKTSYKLNLFNTGVIIDSEKVRKGTLIVLKELIKYV